MLDNLSVHFYKAVDVIFNNIWSLAAGLAIFLVFIFLRKSVAKATGKLIEKIFKAKPAVGAGLRHSVIEPLSVFFIFLGFYLACLVCGTPTAIMAAVTKLIRLCTIFLITWSLVNFTPTAVALIMRSTEKYGKGPNAAAITLLANVMKVVVVALAVVIVISELGFNITGLITGLGLGGLTFSLAAQSTAANLFSGFEIITDKPFDVGDFISTPSVEGKIEDITMRSTRIRTIADKLIVVPNSTLVNEPITNWSQMHKRRVDMVIGLTYDTSTETLRKCVNDIEAMLLEHEDVVNEDILVTFSEFADSSLNISISYFTGTTELDKYLLVKQDVNFKIREIVEKNGADFAFPSSSVYMIK